MIRHERLRPPSRDYPADEWSVVEKAFHPEFLAQLETMLAVGNGYLGMRGGPEEGGPNAENGTFINGFHETWPIVYGEDAFGFARTGQTICNVTDSKIIKLFVDDEPFWLPQAKLLNYDRRLNMKAGTLDREILWETPAGKQVLIRSRRLVSFTDRHVAVISYAVTLLNADAAVVIASEMALPQSSARASADDPRLARAFAGRVLHPRASLFQRVPHRAVPCDREEPPDPRMRDRKHAGKPVPAWLQDGPQPGLRPGGLYDRGPAGAAGLPHQIHGLSHVADRYR